jgi:hypothetical protein
MSTARRSPHTIASAACHQRSRLLAHMARRVRRQMPPRPSHLRLVDPSVSPTTNACRSHGCELAETRADGLCPACHSVYATAEMLYRRLVAREMARMERRTPGIGCAALAALHERLARLDPPVAQPSQHLHAEPDELRWTPEEWENKRLDSFLTELRAAITAAGGGA